MTSSALGSIRNLLSAMEDVVNHNQGSQPTMGIVVMKKDDEKYAIMAYTAS